MASQVLGEIADAVYRDGVYFNLTGHAALVYRYSGNTDTRYIIHSAGGGSYAPNSVRVDSWNNFLDGNNWVGLKAPANMSKAVREAIISDALDQLNAHYWGYGPWDYCYKRANSSSASGDGCFRCDFLVEYVYEQNGHDVCNDTLLFANGPYHQANNMSDATQDYPSVNLLYPDSTDVNNPTVSTAKTITLMASATDISSGLAYLKAYEFFVSEYENNTWGGWQSLGPSNSSKSYTLASGLLHSVVVIVTDNYGNSTESSIHYIKQAVAPAPTITDISTPSSITLGDSFEVAVTVRNDGGDSDDGGVTIEFPQMTGTSDVSFVSHSGGSSDLSFVEKDRGDTLYDKSGNQFNSNYLWTESIDSNWVSGETNTTRVTVKPKQSGSFTVHIRSALGISGIYTGYPASGTLGQQGWPVLSRTVQVNSVDLNVSPNSLNFAHTGGSENVSIDSNVNWSVSDNRSWITVAPTSGSTNGSITVTASTNSGSARSGSVTITGGGITRTVTVAQEGQPVDDFLEVSPNSLNFAHTGGSENVSIDSNVNWSVSDNRSWITVAPTSGSNNGSITVTASTNSGSARSGSVTITGGGITRTVTVAQEGQPVDDFLEVSPNSLNFAHTGGSENVSIDSNVNWSVSDNRSWITVAPTSGSNNGSITVTASTNSGSARSGSLTITGGGITRTVTVAQEGQPVECIEAFSGSGYTPGANASILVSLPSGIPDASNGAGIEMNLPSGWSYVSDTSTGTITKPTGGDTATVGWAWLNGPVQDFTVLVAVPGAQTGSVSLGWAVLLHWKYI
jgi:hypothetical protein